MPSFDPAAPGTLTNMSKAGQNRVDHNWNRLSRKDIRRREVELNRSAVVDDWESLLFQVVAAVLDVLVG
jgi:hypothetical protein